MEHSSILMFLQQSLVFYVSIWMLETEWVSRNWEEMKELQSLEHLV